MLDKPWRVGSLNYLENEMEKWSNRAKQGQAGPNGTQTGQKGAKQGQTRPNRAK